MHFTDRENELGRLQGLMEPGGEGLAVVWGRRRIGKTRLLLEWARLTGGLYWMADESGGPVQRRYFAEALEAKLPGFSQVEYPDWHALFRRLARDAAQVGWRGPLVIDELPFAVNASPELPGVLQRFIDHDARAAKLVVALAGSSQRMMQGLTLAPEAPLYGRARALFKLQPILAGHIGGALGLGEPVDAVEAYALWGGVPRYWELAEPYGNSRAAAEGLILDPLGTLHDEPTRLLLEETPPAVALRPILDAIGGGAHRLSEIGGRIGQSATSLARPIARLQELDLVAREIPFGESERSSKRSLYKIADPFLRFWFSLVASRRSMLLQVNRKARLKLLDEAFPHLCGAAWEDLCRQAVPLLGGRLSEEYGPARRFWSAGGAEWDLVAASHDGKKLLLGEVKWNRREPHATDVERAIKGLREKGVPPLSGAVPQHIEYAVFFPILPHKRPRHPDVHLIDAGAVLSVLR